MNEPKPVDRDGELIEAALEQELVEPQTVTLSPGTRSISLHPDDIPDYDIIREIHRGGQGVVYEAVQRSTYRTVAVKVMLEGNFADERTRWRFEREVQLVAGLKHPHIVSIHDSGLAHGRYFFAMDYIRGQPLDTHIRLTNLAPPQTVRLFLDVCDAVSYAHRHGIIHRDLKPSNILVGEDGDAQVLDFGLAKLLTPEESDGTGRTFVTNAGQIMGTLRYMSPEQTRGDQQAIDTRTDVYSLGVILYELLTHGAPYRTDGDLAEAMRNIREVDPPRPSRLRRELSSDLDAITLKALRKEPDRRYATAEQLRDDLAAWLDGRPVSAKSDSSFYVLRKIAVRHSFETIVIATLVLILVSFTSIALDQSLQARKAQAGQATLAQFAAGRDAQAATAIRSALPVMHDMYLGWFLLEWHQDRLDQARLVQGKLSPAESEYAAMSFLLDSSSTVDQLRSRLPVTAEPLICFVAGEREFKHGNTAQAIRLYSQSLQASGEQKYRSFVKARVGQLQHLTAESEPETTGPRSR